MSKKYRKYEQEEERVPVEVFSDDEALDALVSEYLSEQQGESNYKPNKNSSPMENIMRRLSENNQKKEEKPVMPISATTTKREVEETQNTLVPKVFIDIEHLDRICLKDRLGFVVYTPMIKDESLNGTHLDDDDFGERLNEIKQLLLIDSTPAAIYSFKEFNDLFSDMSVSNTRRFLALVDDDFNFQDTDIIYLFMNGQKFYNSINDVCSMLNRKYGMNNAQIINVLSRLSMKVSANSFIGDLTEGASFYNSKHNLTEPMSQLIRNDRVAKFEATEDTCISEVFNFIHIDDINGLYQSQIMPPSACIDTQDDGGVSNDNEPFPTNTEGGVVQGDIASKPDGGDTRSTEFYTEQGIEKNEEEENEGGDTGIIESDPDTFEWEEKEEKENEDTEPPVTPASNSTKEKEPIKLNTGNNTSQGGSMTIPVFKD